MKILGKKVVDKDFKEILTSQFFSVTGGVIAGVFLFSIFKRLEMLPGIFILLPGFLELHGNLFGSLAARLSTLLHLKNIQPRFERSRLLSVNIASTFVLTILASLFLGVCAYFLNLYIFNSSAPLLVVVSFIAALLALLVELPIVIFTTFWLFKHGYDPDDIMGPYVTTIGDFISILSLFIVIMVML